jgi:dihydroceramidase
VLLDELPMIYASCQALYCILAEGKPTGGKRDKAVCTTFPILVTVVYLAYPNPLFHQAAFAFLHIFMVYRTYFLLKRLPPKRQSIKGGKVNTLRRDADRLLVEGLGLTAFAFAIWNMDNIFCDGITKWRKDERVPYWLGVLSQGHAWWHILSALGINRSVTGVIGVYRISCHVLVLSEALVKGVTIGVQDPDSYEYAYRLKFFPYVRPRCPH